MHALIIGSVREPHQYLYDNQAEVSWIINREFQFSSDVCLPYTRMFVFNKSDPQSLTLEYVRQLDCLCSVDVVCSFHDAAQPLARKIAGMLGLPFLVSDKTLSLTRDKVAMRDLLRNNGLENIAYSLCSNIDEVSQFIIDNTLSGCILKPRDGSGSSGIIKVDNISNLQEKLEHCDFPCLVEEVLEGCEFSVEAFSVGGIHHVLGITQKYTDEATCIETGHIFPAPISQSIAAEITSLCQEFLSLVEVSDGPTHTEVIVTKNGPRIIETHTRAGGDSIPLLVYETTGIDIHTLNAMQQTGLDVSVFLQEFSYSGFAQVGFILPDTPGVKVVSANGFLSSAEKPFVINAKCQYCSGETVRPLKSSFDRIGYVIVKGNTPEECGDLLGKELSICRKQFKTEVTNALLNNS